MRFLAILLSYLIVSCADQSDLHNLPIIEAQVNEVRHTTKKQVRAQTFLKPSELLANRDRFHGKKVKVLAYYIPHHDGDWITEVEGSYKDSTISVPNTGRVNVELKDGRIVQHPSELKWGNNGRPVIIEGEFKKDGVMHHMGVKMTDIAMIYRRRIIEIDSKNEHWLDLYH